MQIVKFQHREPPAVETITIANAVGCALTLDGVSRSLVVVGPVAGVDIVKRYLESIDQPAGTCAVKSWAVYVDKSAQTGFDLVAAIRAVSASSVEATIDGAGVTLDLSADKLAGALAVVCDGSVIEVIQRPHVQLFHGVPAKIESIEEVPIPSTAVSQGVAQTSIEFRKVGLQLDVTPYFLAGDALRLNVVQSNGLLGQLVRIGENEVPVIQSQTVASTVQLSIGQTVVLGGVTTYRNRIVRGLLTNKTERTEGGLYVILSTYYDVPKALPVASIGVPSDPAESREWIADQILPLKGWKKEERDFLRAKEKR
jgi:type II secretory pathway component GspD/PulD (secretin)